MTAFDERLFTWINGFAGSCGPIDWIMQRAANDYLVPVIISLSLLWLWITARRLPRVSDRDHLYWRLWAAMIGGGFASAIVKICNLHYFRTRPFDVTGLPVNLLFYRTVDSSFPSNCAAVTFAVAFGIWLCHRKWGYIVGCLAFLMSFSRVYVGIHYPLDILGGAACGIVATLLGWWLLQGFAKLDRILPASADNLPLTVAYSFLRAPTTLLRFLRFLHLA